MAHTITLSDEDYARLESAAHYSQRSVEQVIADLLARLPNYPPALSDEEYNRRWAGFMRLVGSITQGAPLSNEEIDELIGEEAGETHAVSDRNTSGSSES